ncbi:MAG: HEAT repeat domain-containing protein [Spirochaetes bacterium]|nr:HEAT repeat domain-containing protein [Spirochaetota bacterium]
MRFNNGFFAGICLVLMVSAFISLGAQTGPSGERTAEEAYAQESVEAMILREEAMADGKEMKQKALGGIKDAIAAGRLTDDIRKTLEYLSQEGLTYVNREAGLGRPKNNFPDVRAQACDYLGEFKSEEAKNALLRVLLSDQEPMVLSAAIRSLGKLGMNDNDEVTQAISLIASRFDILFPDNSLAFEVLVAFERIAEATGGLKDPMAIRTIMRIADGNYINPVKNRANELLKTLRKPSK